MHLQQVEEVKAQSQEIWHLLALMEQQQKAIKKVASPRHPTREPRAMTSCSESQLDTIWDEIFNLIQGTVNTKWGAAVASYSLTVTSLINWASFEDMLAEEADFTPSDQLRCVKFTDTLEGGLTSTPHKFTGGSRITNKANLPKPPRRNLAPCSCTGILKDVKAKN